MKKKELLAWFIDGAKIAQAPKGYAAVWQSYRKQFSFKGKAGESAIVWDGEAPTLLLGVAAEDKTRAVFEAAVRAVEIAKREKFSAVVLGGVSASHRDVALRGMEAGRYSFRITKEKPSVAPSVRVLGATSAEMRRAAEVAEAAAFARTLVNLPPAEKFPAKLVARIMAEVRARQAGRRVPRRAGNVRVEVWDEKRLRSERCGGILAVGKGSARPPRLLKLTWSPRGAREHIVLVGKGVTFDSGGLNIKPFEGMKTMKCDMSGAAAVTGAFLAAVRMGLNVRITVLAGFAENMLGGEAFKPGDVLSMRSGKTVEVLNTDAEGRLVLGDLLDIAAGLKSDAIVDCATLTGACVVALGEEIAGLFSTSTPLMEDLRAAGDAAGELVWPLPLNRDFLEKLKGDISDLKNIGGRYGGASSAAAFLAEFAGSGAWAHIDLAGPAFRESGASGRPHGGTGFGVATLTAFLERRARV